MIATKFGSVYQVSLPGEVKRFLEQFAIALTLGIDIVEATPLECVGLSGYTPRMVFWTVAPIILVAFVFLGTAVWLSVKHRRPPLPLVVLQVAAPLVLKLLFLIYPIVTRIAFEAFSFHEFDQGSWMRADVRIQRGTEEYDWAWNAATIAIVLYPIGLLVLFGWLLFRAHHAITQRQPTALSTAIQFLHGEYDTSFYWWEVGRLGASRPMPLLQRSTFAFESV